MKTPMGKQRDADVIFGAVAGSATAAPAVPAFNSGHRVMRTWANVDSVKHEQVAEFMTWAAAEYHAQKCREEDKAKYAYPSSAYYVEAFAR